MITFALDAETYYDDACSVKILGNRAYFDHPDFDAYLVSVVGDNGYTYCGNPRDFDWSMLTGNLVLSHNAAFDEGLYIFGASKGWWPECHPAEWACTADMCAYFGIPRALKNACHWLFGLEIEKTVRDNMKGKRWETMTPEFQKEVTDYAIKDSELCLQLWQKLGPNWSEHERWLSRHHREMMRRGLPIDSDAVRAAVQTMKANLFNAESLIPWAESEKLLSPKAFAAECRKHGIEPPASMAMDDEDTDEWFEQYGEQLPFAAAVRNYRRINSLTKKLEAFERAGYKGRYYGGILYAGSHTRRASGSGGNLNLQNLPRGEMFGVNLRHLIKAGEGKKLVSADLSQIEVRTSVWLAGDTTMMDTIRKTDDIYEAFAIHFGLWSPEQGPLKLNDPALRQRMKTVGLGVQYGASASKIATVAGVPVEEAAEFIRIFHRHMKPIVKLWARLRNLLTVARRDGILELELPSGNSMLYRNVHAGPGRSTIATIVKNGRPVLARLWFGSLLENASQSLARDIFMHRVRAIEEAGWKVLLTIHDEVLIEVDEDDAERCMEEVIAIMSEPPDWISDIALAAEGKILTRYEK